MSKRWQKVELRYLKRYADSKDMQVLADRFHTTVENVEAKLEELQIDRSGSKDRAESEVALIATFEKGMQALYAERWAEAAEALQRVSVGQGPLEVVARARQFAKVASARAQSDASEDPYLKAVVLKNSGDYEGALAACGKPQNRSEEGRFAYLAATIGVLQGDLSKAADHLEQAYALDPRSRGQARHDPDLQALRDDESFGVLFQVETGES